MSQVEISHVVNGAEVETTREDEEFAQIDAVIADSGRPYLSKKKTCENEGLAQTDLDCEKLTLDIMKAKWKNLSSTSKLLMVPSFRTDPPSGEVKAYGRRSTEYSDSAGDL
ncbi:hypothetical protein Glove_365g178 [Diversispora epigaea]|uniref:Uncharacterized protein n=1 Tax=Diversispora epigaea TaxID=1348612 RepID=A0A397HB31_9GLOM|nr:hypothetical protein Glove_365g178 [Diversispora epigaea]